MRRILIVAVVLIGFPTALAHAATHKPYTLPKHAKTCRTHYRKLREHGHIECVWAHKTLIVAPKTTSLAVRLDPDFTVSPTNTLDLTFSYSASATLGTAPDTNLPAGVLEFYSDGLLECSTNVGGDIDGGTCEVVYSDYGDHTTNVIYDSGTNSVTTGPEDINIPAPPMPALELAPLPVTLTTTTIETITETECEQGGSGSDWFDVCTYSLSATVTDDNGPVVGTITFTNPTTGSVICQTAIGASCSTVVGSTIYTDPLHPLACPGVAGNITATYAGDSTDASSNDTEPLPADSLCAPVNVN